MFYGAAVVVVVTGHEHGAQAPSLRVPTLAQLPPSPSYSPRGLQSSLQNSHSRPKLSILRLHRGPEPRERLKLESPESSQLYQ